MQYRFGVKERKDLLIQKLMLMREDQTDETISKEEKDEKEDK